MMKTYVCLHRINTPTLIIPKETGIIYFNQVGGVSCIQKEIEGYVLPIPYLDPDIYIIFMKIYCIKMFKFRSFVT